MNRVTALLATLLVAGAAHAADTATGEGAAARTTRVTKKSGPRRIMRLKEVRVEGHVQKPQALFIVPPADLKIGGMLSQDEDLAAKVAAATRAEPF